MATSHYDVLGVKRQATEVEIRAAYRKLVLRHHPDRSSDPRSPQIFMRVTQAFEVLSDATDRRRYDQQLDADARRAERAEQDRSVKEAEERRRRQQAREQAARAGPKVPPPSEAPKKGTNEPGAVSTATMVTRLSVLFSRQQYADCEKLARDILRKDSRQPLPYAVLGDISRSRGNFDEAARLYSYALQMEPQNAGYLRRYEEILERSEIRAHGRRVAAKPEEKRMFSVLAIVAISVMACLYVILSPERSALAVIPPVSSWTLGLVVMLFLCGVSAGAALAVGNLVDRVDAFSTGRLSPAVALGLIALVSFPAACLLYLIIGATQRAFNLTTTRLVAAVGILTGALSLASFASTASIAAGQVLLWGGNLVYLGALCGWTVADSFRR